MALDLAAQAHCVSCFVGEAYQIFEFEADFAADLRCIPMIVRLKLDRCGIKLSLRQWSRFTSADRAGLMTMRCDTDPETARFRNAVVRLINERSGDSVKCLPVEANPPWTRIDFVPCRIVQHAANIGIEPPSLAAWSSLSPLQRFALLKLTRDNHDNENFLPAMSEFGLAT
ncbi:MAG: hypothetical protein GC155_13445 [Alphaproteobacteria bacterium]|nr:hypothetical protein [Alphaproteobacteria bacterium]